MNQDFQTVSGRVARIIPFSGVDGPGNRFVVFFQGCDFNCIYCHNPETKGMNPIGQGVTRVDDIIEQIRPIRPFIRGVTLSGGEVFLQPDFAKAILEATKQEFGLPTLIDTCGSRSFEEYKTIVDLAEGIMLDVKVWDVDQHQRVTGRRNDIVLKNLGWGLKNHSITEVRTVVLPQKFDCKQTVKEVSRVLALENESIPYVLIRFRPQGVLKPWNDLPVPEMGYMDELRNLALSMGHRNVVVL